MGVRKHRNSDNPDWVHVRDEVSNALVLFVDWRIGAVPASAVISEIGDALVALAEHNGIDGAYIYGKETQ